MTTLERTRTAQAMRRRYAGVPSVASMERRLERILQRATPEQHEQGELWYDRFALVAETLGDCYGVSRETAAGVLAICSPRVPVWLSVRMARDVLATVTDGGDVSAIAGSWQRFVAEQYLNGDPSALAMDEDGLTESRKVRSFWRNIIGDEDAVTLDVWAQRAVGAREDRTLTRGAYLQVAEVYRRVAARHGLTPRTLQAIAWVVTSEDETDTAALLSIATAEPTIGARVEAPATAI